MRRRRKKSSHRDTKTQEGEITYRHFRRIKGELTDLKDFIYKRRSIYSYRQERLKTSKAVLHHGATDISDVVFILERCV